MVGDPVTLVSTSPCKASEDYFLIESEEGRKVEETIQHPWKRRHLLPVSIQNALISSPPTCCPDVDVFTEGKSDDCFVNMVSNADWTQLTPNALKSHDCLLIRHRDAHGFFRRCVHERVLGAVLPLLRKPRCTTSDEVAIPTIMCRNFSQLSFCNFLKTEAAMHLSTYPPHIFTDSDIYIDRKYLDDDCFS